MTTPNRKLFRKTVPGDMVIDVTFGIRFIYAVAYTNHAGHMVYELRNGKYAKLSDPAMFGELCKP